MSFSFQWPRFSEQFHTDAIAMLNSALNKGTKPPVIADRIEVVELEMGTQVRTVCCLLNMMSCPQREPSRLNWRFGILAT